jgi:hypothetical protein
LTGNAVTGIRQLKDFIGKRIFTNGYILKKDLERFNKTKPPEESGGFKV